MQTQSIKLNLLAFALAGAGLLFANAADACTIGAWTGASATAPTASNPGTAAAAPRWAGECGLQVAGTERFVFDDSPNGTTDGTANPYRARFYVYTRWTGGNAQVLRATDANGGGGNQVFGVTYNPTAGSFAFEYGTGVSVGSITGIAPNRWYGVEVMYQSGSPLSAFVVGQGIATEATLAPGANAPAVAVNSVRLGNSGSAGTGSLAFDDFESTRSAASRIGWLCRGDALDTGSVSVLDAIRIARESIPPRPLSPGIPDCNRDGEVSIADATCAARLALPPIGGNCANIR